MSGAIMLCGEAALRSGAGKVTLATHPDHALVINATRPELMVHSTSDGAEMQSLLESADVLILGPGLGREAWSKSMRQACWGHEKPMVMDADALNLAAREGDIEMTSGFGARCVITPHPAEAARLLGSSAQEVQNDRVSAARELAGQSGAVVILKGCGTVVAEPGGRHAICPLGNPGMATAGAGDVLAGVVGALMAQGFEPWRAATMGVVAHAMAGDKAAREIGERGLLASDIMRQLPGVLNPREKLRGDW
jgi:NAD(P)H-hydrate epimerase